MARMKGKAACISSMDATCIIVGDYIAQKCNECRLVYSERYYNKQPQ